MPKQVIDTERLSIICKSVNRNYLIYKEIGAEVLIHPKEKKFKRLWSIAEFNQFNRFPNPRTARKLLLKEFGPVNIRLDVHFFGRVTGYPNPIEVEKARMHKTCTVFRCVAKHSAVGFKIKFESDGSIVGAGGLVDIALGSVKAQAIVEVNGKTYQLSAEK